MCESTRGSFAFMSSRFFYHGGKERTAKSGAISDSCLGLCTPFGDH